VHAALLHRPLDDGELVAHVGDGEALGEAEAADLLAEHLRAERVEGADEDALRPGAGEVHHPLLHLRGGLVGEGDGEDGLGGDLLVQQVGDAVGDDAGLAGAGAREHQHRALRGGDGLALRGVEAAQVHGEERASYHGSASVRAVATKSPFARTTPPAAAEPVTPTAEQRQKFLTMGKREFQEEYGQLLKNFTADPGNPGSYGCEGCARCANCMFCRACDSCYSCNYCVKCELCNSCSHCLESKQCHACAYCVQSENCTNSAYLVLCKNLSDSNYCFGCVGLTKKDFYVLNLPFSRKEYFAITSRLRKELGITMPGEKAR